MVYRVNIISSISRNSAFSEVGGRDPLATPYISISRNSAVSEVGGGIEDVPSQYHLLYFQEFCISRGGGEGPNA